MEEFSLAEKKYMDREWLCEQYASGLTTRQIATLAGTNKTTIRQWLIKFGVTLRSRLATDLTYDFLYDAYVTKNMLIHDIEQLTGHKWETVRNKLIEHGIQIVDKDDQRIERAVNALKSVWDTHEVKMRDGLKAKYGVEYGFQSKEIQDSVKESFVEKYGVDNSQKIPQVLQKRIATNIERFGGQSPMSDPDVRKKAKEKIFERYGVHHQMLIPAVKEKVKSTLKERYGDTVTVPFLIPEILAQTKLNRSEINAKMHATKKQMGSYGKSKAEDRCFEFIRSEIDVLVERQASFNEWSVDFYLPAFDLYVEFHGDFYHGYNRSEEYLRTIKTGLTILKTKERDRAKAKEIENLVVIRESEFAEDASILQNRILNKYLQLNVIRN